MSLEEFDILELKDRYQDIIEKYAKLALKVAPELDKLGKYRKELQILSTEFVRRGVQLDDPEHLEKMIKQEMEKRK